MSASPVARPLDKLKRIRSWDELRTRGVQAVSAYREQKRVPHVPDDAKFLSLIDAAQFGKRPIIAESLWQRFFKHGERSFFPSLTGASLVGRHFRQVFGEAAAKRFVESAEEILLGRIDLLGFKGLYVGTDIDWHREPISAKRSPLTHWKDFDDLDTSETGNKKIIWELNRHQHFFTLGVAYALTRDERYGEAFAAQLDSWMEKNPPAIGVNWSSSLEVAFRAMSWIWAFHLFRDSDAFTPELFRRALKFLYLHGRHIEQYLSKYYSPNTHLTGEALALYYLGTQLSIFSRSERWRRLGEDILFDESTKQIHADGVYFEQSTWYQRYTADIYAHFIVLRTLDQKAGPELRTQEFAGRIEKCFEHLMFMTMPDGSTPLIGDDDGGRLLPLTVCAEPDDFRGTLAVGARLFDRSDMKQVAGDASQELFWLTGRPGVGAYRSVPPAEPTETSRAFADGGYFVMRDGWEATDNALVVDCGELGSLAAGHAHADALAIEVAIHGRPLLVDPGTYTYHESRELRDFFRSTEAHNTLMVDGLSSSEPGDTFGWSCRAKARLGKWISDDRFDFFAGSHDGYCRLSDPVTHSRSILGIKNGYWIIRDLAEAKESHEYSLNFHYADGLRPAIVDDISIGDGDHRIITFGDNGEWELKESWVSRNHGNKINAPFVRFAAKAAGTREFFTFIVPCHGSRAKVSEMQTRHGRIFAVEFDDRYIDLLIFNDEPGSLISFGDLQTSFEYTWSRLRKGEELPDELVAVNGDHLSLNAVDLVDEACGGHASVRRFGTEFYVQTANGRAKISYESLK